MLRQLSRPLSSDEDELSVGGPTPPPAPSPAPTAQKMDAGREIQTALKFSIDNILNPEFGRSSGGVGGVADGTGGVATAAFLSGFYRQMILAAQVPFTGVTTPKTPASAIDLSIKNGASSDGSVSPNRSVSVGGSSSVGNGEGGVGSATSGGAQEPAAASGASSGANKEILWPAWVYCTRYSDRPSSGRSPRSRRIRKKERSGSGGGPATGSKAEEKRPRTAFTSDQLARLKTEFSENRYLTEKRRQDLARELQLHENQIKIWFQNKRAKIKKASGQKNPLALQLMAQGLYNHSTMALDDDDMDDMDDEEHLIHDD